MAIFGSRPEMITAISSILMAVICKTHLRIGLHNTGVNKTIVPDCPYQLPERI